MGQFVLVMDPSTTMNSWPIIPVTKVLKVLGALLYPKMGTHRTFIKESRLPPIIETSPYSGILWFLCISGVAYYSLFPKMDAPLDLTNYNTIWYI